jgi:hypothetical protein
MKKARQFTKRQIIVKNKLFESLLPGVNVTVTKVTVTFTPGNNNLSRDSNPEPFAQQADIVTTKGYGTKCTTASL